MLLMKAAVCADMDHVMAEASEPNVIQIDAFGKVSTNADSDMDDKRLLLEELRLRKEMMMRRSRRKDGPTIIMMPSLSAPPPEPQFAVSASQDTDTRASYDSHSYYRGKSCYVTTNICDKNQDQILKKTVQRTVQKSIESSVKNGLKQALVPMFEELTRRMSEDLPLSVVKKYQEDLHSYASKFLDRL